MGARLQARQNSHETLCTLRRGTGTRQPYIGSNFTITALSALVSPHVRHCRRENPQKSDPFRSLYLALAKIVGLFERLQRVPTWRSALFISTAKKRGFLGFFEATVDG